MAIDPRLYEKYSGRRGNPMDRLGSALAQSAQQKSRNAEARDHARAVRTSTPGGGVFGALLRLLRISSRM
jgi:hypothetical protein